MINFFVNEFFTCEITLFSETPVTTTQRSRGLRMTRTNVITSFWIIQSYRTLIIRRKK